MPAPGMPMHLPAVSGLLSDFNRLSRGEIACVRTYLCIEPLLTLIVFSVIRRLFSAIECQPIKRRVRSGRNTLSLFRGFIFIFAVSIVVMPRKFVFMLLKVSGTNINYPKITNILRISKKRRHLPISPYG